MANKRLRATGTVAVLLLAGSVAAQDGFGSDDLRVVEYDLFGDSFADVELTVEPGDASILFYARAADANDSLILGYIADADDETIYDLEEDVNIFGFEPYSETGGELAVFLPAAPQFDLEPGTYYFGFETGGSELVELYALIRSGAVEGRQALDLNLWIARENGALSSGGEQAAFERQIRGPIDALLNPHKLTIGAINFFVANAQDVRDFALSSVTEDSDDALRDVCVAMGAAVGSNRALNVALVDEILENGEISDTVGVGMAAGNAGVISRPDSGFSCVVVAWFPFAEGAVYAYEEQAANIIHEASHFLSLPHTTEEEGETFDLFDDTAECAIELFDGNGDGIVDEFECDVAGGARNYMFWAGAAEFAPFEMSPAQAWTLRRHPLFYALDD